MEWAIAIPRPSIDKNVHVHTFASTGDKFLIEAAEARMDRVKSLGQPLIFPNQNPVLKASRRDSD